MDQSSMAALALEIIKSLVSTKYATVASTTLLLWDMLLTFDLEVHRVWAVKKTRGTTLFFLNRYFVPFLFLLDIYADFFVNSSTRNYLIASTILQLFSILIVELVLVIRTHALYQNKGLLLFLATLCLISAVNILVIFFVLTKSLETVSPGSMLGVSGCVIGCAHPVCKPLLIGFWIPFLFFETLVFFLTVLKSYTTFRTFKKARIAGRSATFMEIIVRDGLAYYIVIMAISITNFLIWIVDPFASYVAVGLLKCLQATICSRLLLNIRGMLEVGGTMHPSISTISVGPMNVDSTLVHPIHSQSFGLKERSITKQNDPSFM